VLLSVSNSGRVLQCYSCKEYSHIRPECLNRDKWSIEDRAVRKVGASALKAKGTAKGLNKSEP
jgi:hypothetical protein